MGCDVHPVIQVRDAKLKDWWESVAIPDRTRCYPFFEALAGVREGYGLVSGIPITRPRGLPSDFKDYVGEKFLSDEHTPSWFTLTEARAYDASWLLKAYTDGEWPFVQWTRWLRTMEFFAELYGAQPDDVRVVFDFDS